MTEATVDLLYPGVWGRLHTGEHKDGPILFGICSVPLVTSAGVRILIDTGHYGTRMHLEAALRSRGLGFDDIDHVVMTHPHWDHILNIEAFGRASVVTHAGSLEYARQPPDHDWAVIRHLDAILENRSIDLVEDGTELAPGVTVIETPGHTKADISIAVDTANGKALLTSDAVTNMRGMLDRTPRLIFHDPDQAARSIERISQMAEIVYPGHDRPFTVASDGRCEYLIDGYLEMTAVEWYGDRNDYNVVVRTPLDREGSVSEK